MYFLITLAIVVAGALSHIFLSGATHAGVVRVAELSLVWLLAGYYGVVTLNAGLQHLVHSDRIAGYIGWASGSGFQLELGWAEVGLGCAAIPAIWFRGPYLLAPAIAGSVLFLGAAIVHAKDIAKRGNLNPGNAGAVFYIDLIVPLMVAILVILYRPWAVRP